MPTVTVINGYLAESVEALTAILAGYPEQLERHVAERQSQGRPALQQLAGVGTPDALAAALVAEIHGLIGTVLHALRTRAVDGDGQRLAAYEAVDLAGRRAASATAELRLAAQVREAAGATDVG